MKVIDLHPEELIDRARMRALTPDEQAHLDQHLAHCVACRFELLLRDDFAAEAGEGSLHTLVSNALVAAAEPSSELVVVPAGRKMRRLSWNFLVAAAVLLMSGLAAAQVGVVTQVMSFVAAEVKQLLGREVQGPQPPLHARRAAPKSRVVQAASTEKVVASAPSAIEPRTDTRAVAMPAPAVEPAGTNSTASPNLPSPRLAPVRPSQLAPQPPRAAPTAKRSSSEAVRSGSSSAPTPPTNAQPAPEGTGEPARATAPRPTPSDPPGALFERANALRRAGAVSEARALYRELQARFAGSPEARLGLAVAGRLELDRGDPRAALRAFDAYLASGDASLREEALAGRALAFGRLADHASECSAFATLLRAYPRSAYGSLANSRCAGLE